MKTKEQIDKMPLDKYIFWLNSMTTAELHKEFPGEFNKLKAGDSQGETVKNMLANDAILWRFVKTHAQKLASELTEKESEVRTAEEILMGILESFDMYLRKAYGEIRFNYDDAAGFVKKLYISDEFAFQSQQPEKEQPSESNSQIRSLGIATTIGELKELIKNYPDDTSFRFRNQPMQKLYEVKYDDIVFVTFQ